MILMLAPLTHAILPLDVALHRLTVTITIFVQMMHAMKPAASVFTPL
jgi:hypothetical protein